jgi:hypothetical protein
MSLFFSGKFFGVITFFSYHEVVGELSPIERSALD